MKPIPRRSGKPTRQNYITTFFYALSFIAVFWLIINLVRFTQSRDRLPTSTLINDLDVSGLTVNEAISRTTNALSQPVILRYQNETIPITPDAIEYRVNSVLLQLSLNAVLDQNRGIAQFPTWLQGRTRLNKIDLPYMYSDAKVVNMIASIAKQYDRAANDVAADVGKLTLTQAANGNVLHQPDAVQVLLSAMGSNISRNVQLPVDVIPASTSASNAFADLVQKRLSAFINADKANSAGLYIKDINTGREVVVNGAVPFSARGWLKMLVVFAAYQSLGEQINPTLRAQLSDLITTDKPEAINQTLSAIGSGDLDKGIATLNKSLRQMGMRNTFLASAFASSTPSMTIITPANASIPPRPSLDPFAQSTVVDMGVFLEAIAQCRKNTGNFVAIFDNKLTSATCEQIYGIYAKNAPAGMLDIAVPNAKVAHRQSWDKFNHGDAAMISTPNGDYVIALMLTSTNELDWGATVPVMNDIARIAYGYFNNSAVPAAPNRPFVPPPQ